MSDKHSRTKGAAKRSALLETINELEQEKKRLLALREAVVPVPEDDVME